MGPHENENEASPFASNTSSPNNGADDDDDYEGMPELLPRSPVATTTGNAATVRRVNGNGHGVAGGGEVEDGWDDGSKLRVETVRSDESDDEDDDDDDEEKVPGRMYFGHSICRVILAGGKIVCGNDCITCMRPTHTIKRSEPSKCGKEGWYNPSLAQKVSPRRAANGQRDGILASYESEEMEQDRRVAVRLEMDQAADEMARRNGTWAKVGKSGKTTKDNDLEEEYRALEAIPPPLPPTIRTTPEVVRKRKSRSFPSRKRTPSKEVGLRW
jgi:hypothetical protein